jgi:hypothetical protein
MAEAFEKAGDFDRAMAFAKEAARPPSYNTETNFLEGNSSYMSKLRGESTSLVLPAFCC